MDTPAWYVVGDARVQVTRGSRRAPRVVVTADDYGADAGATAAIEALALAGRLSAVSAMAHEGARLDRAARLAAAPVWVGAHVVLTGAPGLPPGPAAFVASLARGRTSLARVRAAAERQCERLAATGLRVAFVNAHEHLQALPPLWPIFAELSERVGAASVRLALGQLPSPSVAGALALASQLSRVVRAPATPEVWSPLGAGRAGALDEAVVARLLAAPFREAEGRVRELCLHPAAHPPERAREHAWLASGGLDRWLEIHGFSRAVPSDPAG